MEETDMSEVQRDLGRLEARADSHDERLQRIEGKIDLITEKVDKLHAYEQRRRGAMAVLMTVAGAVGAAVMEGLRALWSR